MQENNTAYVSPETDPIWRKGQISCESHMDERNKTKVNT